MSSVRVWIRSLCAAVAVLFMVLLGWAPAANAHAVLLSTDPANGSTVQTPPTHFTLTFNEDVDVNKTVITLINGQGKAVDIGTPRGVGDPTAKAAKSITVSLSNLTNDRYLVRWSSITTDDFHPVNGIVTFGVGVVVQPAATAVARPVGGPFESAVRSFTYLGYVVVVGAFELLLLLRRPLRARPQAYRTLGRGALGGAVAAAVGLVALLTSLSIRASGLPSATFLKFWGVGLVSVVALAIITRALAKRDHEGAVNLPLAVVGGLTTISAAWGLGHLGHGVITSGVLVTMLHLVSTAMWAGGVALLVPMCIAAVRTAAPGWARHVVKRFTWIAVPGLGLSIFSGALMARGIVPSWGGLVDTTYGFALVLKIMLVGVAMLLGAYTFMRSRKARPDGKLAGRLTAELSAIVLVIIAAAALSGGQPPNDGRWQPKPAAAPTVGTISNDIGDLAFALTLSPSLPGQNFATVGVFEERRPAPAQIKSVSISVDGAPMHVATPQSKIEWMLPVQSLSEGRHTVHIVVDRPGYDRPEATFVWNVAPLPGTDLGGAAIGGLWMALAVMTAVVGGIIAIVAFMLIRSRRRRESERQAADIAGTSAEELVSNA